MSGAMNKKIEEQSFTPALGLEEHADWISKLKLFMGYCLYALALSLVVAIFTQEMGSGDSQKYLSIAQSPGVLIESPWGYRIGAPYVAIFLADSFHFSIVHGFALLQHLMFAVFVGTCMYWIRHWLRLSLWASLAASSLFALSFAAAYYLHNVTHTGFSEHLFLLLGCAAIYRGYFHALLYIAFASCFFKENIGFILAFSYLIHAFVAHGRVPALRFASLMAVVLGSFLFLRSGILFVNSDGFSKYSSFYNLDWFVYVYHYWGGIVGGFGRIVATFGPTWLLAACGFVICRRDMRSFAIVLLIACGQILIAADVLRLISISAFVIVLYSAVTFQALGKARSFLLCVLNGAYFLALNQQWSASAVLAGTLVFTAALLFHSRHDLQTAYYSNH